MHGIGGAESHQVLSPQQSALKRKHVVKVAVKQHNVNQPTVPLAVEFNALDTSQFMGQRHAN